jgi:pyruvate kinase
MTQTRLTKIIATLGPVTDSPEMLGKLIDAGVSIFRFNMSHANHDWVRRVAADARREAERRGHALGLLLDTQGPSIRTGDVAAPIILNPGDRISFYSRGETPPAGSTEKWTSVGYDDFPADVEVGKTIIVDNGGIKLRVVDKTATRVDCEALNDGRMGSRRHINLPGVRVSMPALTEKDKEDVQLGLEVGVDFIAQSFVRDSEDVEQMRELVSSSPHQPKLIAKIEHQFAVDHFDAIARSADAIMVARGDLGIECPYEELPIIQRRIVKKCHEMGRPVIVATHLLESMIQNPTPTRAEVTDIANAAFEQADAIMLSGETTTGKHPLACVEVMDTIARRIERSGGAGFAELAHLTSPRQKLVKSAVLLADELRAAAILVFTQRGYMAQYTSWLRPKYSPIYAFSERWPTADGLTLHRSLTPMVVPFDHENPEQTVNAAFKLLRQMGRLRRGDVVVVISTVSAGEELVEAVKIRTGV